MIQCISMYVRIPTPSYRMLGNEHKSPPDTNNLTGELDLLSITTRRRISNKLIYFVAFRSSSVACYICIWRLLSSSVDSRFQKKLLRWLGTNTKALHMNLPPACHDFNHFYYCGLDSLPIYKSLQKIQNYSPMTDTRCPLSWKRQVL